MAWFKRKDKKLKNPIKKSIPDGLWGKCPSCYEIIYKPELEKNLSVCHHCNHHFRVSPEVYTELILDKNSGKRIFDNIKPIDFLKFKASKEYKNQIMDASKKTNELDAIKVFDGEINGKNIILGIMNFQFIGGSMGSVVGEVVSRAIVLAGKKDIPLISLLSRLKSFLLSFLKSLGLLTRSKNSYFFLYFSFLFIFFKN